MAEHSRRVETSGPNNLNIMNPDNGAYHEMRSEADLATNCRQQETSDAISEVPAQDPEVVNITNSLDAMLLFCRRGNRQQALDLAARLSADSTGSLWPDEGSLEQQEEGGGGTALFWACSHGLSDVVGALLGLGARVDSVNCNGATPLHAAADHGRVEIIRQLLLHGADPRAVTRLGDTPCHLAAYRGYHRAVKALLLGGAAPGARNWRGYDVLDEAHAGTDLRRKQFIVNIVAKYSRAGINT